MEQEIEFLNFFGVKLAFSQLNKMNYELYRDNGPEAELLLLNASRGDKVKNINNSLFLNCLTLITELKKNLDSRPIITLEHMILKNFESPQIHTYIELEFFR